MTNQDATAPAADADLFLELGRNLQAVQVKAAATSGLESLRAVGGGYESAADLVNLGRSYFQRISATAYTIICGSGNGSADWKLLVTQGETALIGAIAALLVAHLALIATVASAVAAIIVKLFFDATSAEFCSHWKASLPAPVG